MPYPFYVVRVGKTPGIYRSWSECRIQTDGVGGAVFKGFNNETEAVMFFKDVATVAVPTVAIVSYSPIRIQPSVLPTLERITRNTDNLQMLYVDGGHNRQTGIEAWGRVVDSTGVDLIAPHVHLFPDFCLRDVVLPRMGASYVLVAKFNDVKQQNNGAELIALVAGLRIAEYYKGQVKVIGSDSTTVLFWSRTLGSESRAKMDPRKAELIDECIKRRREFEASGGQVVKIDGCDNKADLGRH